MALSLDQSTGVYPDLFLQMLYVSIIVMLDIFQRLHELQRVLHKIVWLRMSCGVLCGGGGGDDDGVSGCISSNEF